MVAVDLIDTLIFTEEDSNEITVCVVFSGLGSPENAGRLRRAAGPASTDADGEGIPTGSDNLVVKAAQLLREHAGVERGVRIALVKPHPLCCRPWLEGPERCSQRR